MNEQKVFLVRAGSNGEDEDYALDNGLAIIGFRDFPSLQNLTNWQDSIALVKHAQPDLQSRTAGNYAGQLWAFSVAMNVGDIVVLPRKSTSQIALGRVTGKYKFLKIGDTFRHTREVHWIRPDIARTVFAQDLLNSFGAYLTVCTISRNDAVRRIAAVLDGKTDSGTSSLVSKPNTSSIEKLVSDVDAEIDLIEAAQDKIVETIGKHFKEHDFARLIEAILQAEGWVTKFSPPGPDGGVDILAGRGCLGLDLPRLCVQVKSQNSSADVTVYRTLQGVMQTFKADQGLLVCWGGFNKAVRSEARQGHFIVRLWDSGDVVDAIYRNYQRMPAEIQALLPLKQVWMLVNKDRED